MLHFLRRITGALEAEAAKDDSADKTQREKDDLDAQQEMARWAWWMMLAAFLQAGVGGVGIWYIRSTLQQNRTATEAAIKAAQASEFMLLQSERTAERQLRAYVGYDSAQFVIGSDELPEHVLINLRNAGQTPAYKLHGWISRGPGMAGEKRHPISMTNIGPNQFHTTPVFLPDFDRNTFDEKTTAGRYHIWGEVKYFDAFDRERTTKFCIFDDGPGPIKGKRRFAVSADGNDAT